MARRFQRREFLKMAIFGVIAVYAQKLFAKGLMPNPGMAPLTNFVVANDSANPGNFHAIFDDQKSKDEFFSFLANVYNIYPEKKFQDLIISLVQKNKTDEEIYKGILDNISSIKPIFSELTYALPALSHQKEEIIKQTMQFLKDKKTIDGYLEIGTPGRHINDLREQLQINGDLALVNVAEPTFSPLDIAERGQLTKLGRYIPLNDYVPISENMAADASFEVAINYIGFHHSTLDKLHPFVASIQRVIKPGGKLILRDHDVVDEKMNYMVALAHDVFNAGLKNSWDYNHSEVRHFRPLSDWIVFLKERGFEYQGKQLYQSGDPTRNAFMEFIRV